MTKLENDLFSKQKCDKLRKNLAFSGSYFADSVGIVVIFCHWSQNRVVPGRRVVPSRAFTRQVGLQNIQGTLITKADMHKIIIAFYLILVISTVGISAPSIFCILKFLVIQVY